MYMDSVNKWLTLAANLGVIAGIIIVAIELQQAQTEMRAESSALRAQMSIDNTMLSYQFDIPGLANKIRIGEELTYDEKQQTFTFFISLLRFFETLHYQYQVGALDEEIWQSNLTSLSGLCASENTIFHYTFPDGITRMATAQSTRASAQFRSSFYDVLPEGCLNSYDEGR